MKLMQLSLGAADLPSVREMLSSSLPLSAEKTPSSSLEPSSLGDPNFLPLLYLPPYLSLCPQAQGSQLSHCFFCNTGGWGWICCQTRMKEATPVHPSGEAGGWSQLLLSRPQPTLTQLTCQQLACPG